MGIEKFLITSAVTLVIAQRLVRVLCNKCKQGFKPPMEFLKKVFPEKKDFSNVVVYRAQGCPECHDSGYYGRHPIFEILPIDNTIRRQMQVDPSIEQLRKVIRAKGVQSLRDNGLNLVFQGITTFEEVIRTTVDEHSHSKAA
jgi:type II secretory ATPase GspE/PulE/Tfp pilus assembly ATPase PilB-like protein